MSSIVLSGDTSGTVTVSVPAVAGTNTATLPAATGTVMVSGNMPAFSAYQSSSQTLTNNTLTKIQLQSEEFDTANCFDSTTNYRFTPNVAGYYQISGCLYIGSATGEVIVALYKNGSLAKYLQDINSVSSSILSGTTLIYMNGTTDYLEFYGYQNSGLSKTTGNGSATTWFCGSMVRSA